MIRLAPENLNTLLCIGCHADDIEIGCGGALLRLLREHPRARVCWVVLSADGEREAEAKRSAARFLDGAASSEIIVQRFRDTLFPCDYQAIKAFYRELSGRVQPDAVFTHRLEDAHQDHRVAAELTWQAFRDHLILEYEIPKYEGDLGRPNVYVPLDEATARRKISLTVEAFPTQHDKPWFRAENFEALLRLRGLECKAEFAEAFHCRKMTL